MNKPAEAVATAVDGIQERLTSYACDLNFDDLGLQTIHAAKVRIIDTLGALIAGFFSEPSRIARNLAVKTVSPQGATVLGTRTKTAPEMAAFANGTAARYWELTDTYHYPGSFGGHPSDVVPALLAVAEYTQASGREFIAAVVLAYEIYLRINDIFDNMGFDHTNMCCLATAVGAGKLLRLSSRQLAHCISMAVVPNNALRLARMGHLSMWKATATGQAGKAGVFAAQLADAGMEGPHLPFEGKSGWCDHVALKRFSLDTMGGNDTSFKILDTTFKLRPSVGWAISLILATEKIPPINLREIKEIVVELHKKAKAHIGTHAHHWSPDSKETADHSAAYLVAAALMDGTITPRSYSDNRLWHPDIRALLPRIKVIENDEFTQAYGRIPAEHHARLTVVTNSGKRLVGESGHGKDELHAPKSDAQIAAKFRGLTEDYLGARRVNAILERLWHLEDLENTTEIPPDFVIG